MRAVIYKRVSVLKDKMDGSSLDVQQERLEAYAKAHGWDVVDVYVDPGISAKDTNRPALQRMLKDAEAEKFDVILVYKLDRLSRSVTDFHNLANYLDGHRVSLVSVTQHLDTTSPTGRLLRNILVDFANFERELITERVVDNKMHRAAEGKWNGGHAPFGYKLVNKKIQLVPDEAKKVKEVYSLYLKGNLSMREISRLTGISFSRVELILMNPIYAGKLAWGKTKYKDTKGKFQRKPIDEWIMADSEHEPVITYAEWQKVQKIKQAKAFNPKDRNKTQLFKDLMYCGKCGRKMYYFYNRQGDKYYNYYRCDDVNRMEGCKETSVRQDEIALKSIRKLSDLLNDKKFWKKVSENFERISEDDNTAKEIEEIDNQITKIEQKINRLIKQMADEDIAHLIKPELLRLELEKKNLLFKKTESETETDVSPLSPMVTEQIMDDVSANWKDLTFEEQREGIHLLIKSLTCTNDKVVLKWTDEALPDVSFLLDQRAGNGRIVKSRF